LVVRRSLYETPSGCVGVLTDTGMDRWLIPTKKRERWTSLIHINIIHNARYIFESSLQRQGYL
jgi:hypothetical protein